MGPHIHLGSATLFVTHKSRGFVWMGGFPACMVETTKPPDESSLPIEFGAEG
jgi:hypothetical protein